MGEMKQTKKQKKKTLIELRKVMKEPGKPI